MGKITLNYTFNNPNSVEDTAEMLLKLFIEANKAKVEEVIKESCIVKKDCSKSENVGKIFSGE